MEFYDIVWQTYFSASKFSSKTSTSESEIREKLRSFGEKIENLEKENLELKEENIELLKEVENAQNPTDQKYQKIQGIFQYFFTV